MEHCRQRGDRRVRGRPRPVPGSDGGGRGEAGAARPCRACGDLRGASPARLSLAQRLAVPLDAGRAVPGDGPCILGLWFPGRLAEKSLAEGRLASRSGPAPRAGASRSPLPRFSFDHLSDDGAGPDAFLTWLSCAPRETSLSEKPLAPAAFPGAAEHWAARQSPLSASSVALRFRLSPVQQIFTEHLFRCEDHIEAIKYRLFLEKLSDQSGRCSLSTEPRDLPYVH